MAIEPSAPSVERLVGRLNRLQAEYGVEVADADEESPAAALDSLEDAVAAAPSSYRPYLEEALGCYRQGLYRAAILMVWSATIEHLYGVAAAHRGGVAALQASNAVRFSKSRNYRVIKKRADFLYLGEKDFIQLAEDAGLLNRNARQALHQRLETRNLCGHPTGYQPGREEAVVFIESLTLNVLSGSWLDW